MWNFDPNALARQVVALALIVIAAGIPAAWTFVLGRIGRGEPAIAEGGPRPVPWGAGTVLAVLLVWVSIQLAVAGLAGRLVGRDFTRLTIVEQMGLLSVSNAIIVLFVPVLVHRLSGGTLADLGVSPSGIGPRLRDGLVAMLMLLPFVYTVQYLAVQVWESQAHDMEKMIRRDLNGPTAALAILSGVLLAPAAEELIFRGVILGWLTRRMNPAPADPTAVDDPKPPDLEFRPTLVDEDQPLDGSSWLRAWLPNILVSLAFAAIHAGQWPAPLPIFVLSMGFGYVYTRTGSILSTFAMHAILNATSTLTLFLITLSADPSPAPEPPPTVAPPAAAVPR